MPSNVPSPWGRRGQIDDRTAEGQHYRVAGLNLLAAIIIYWNTAQLGRIVTGMSSSGVAPDPALLAHVSPLGREHIHLTGNIAGLLRVGFRPLPQRTRR